MPLSGVALGGLRFSLVGAGRVGRSLTIWAASAGARPVAVAGRDPRRDAEFAARFGAVAVSTGELCSEGQDLLLVAVPDPALAEVAALLAIRPQSRVVWQAVHRDMVNAARIRAVLDFLGRLFMMKPDKKPDPK